LALHASGHRAGLAAGGFGGRSAMGSRVSAVGQDARRRWADLPAAQKSLRGPSEPHRARKTIRPGRELWAAVWFRRQAEPGWSPQEPVIIPSTGQAQFDLSSVPPGEHNVRLLAWATNPPGLAAVTLPNLTFGQQAEQDGGPASAGR
jgi:hypothetical protein